MNALLDAICKIISNIWGAIMLLSSPSNMFWEQRVFELIDRMLEQRTLLKFKMASNKVLSLSSQLNMQFF